MKNALSLLMVVLLSSCSVLKPKEAELQAEIYQYGLYATVGEYYTEGNTNIPSGKFGFSTGGIGFLKETDKVPLKMGVRFGYDFRIKGLPDGKYMLKCVVTHPPITRHDGKTLTQFEYDKEIEIIDGVADDGADYFINHDYELVGGKWARSYFYKGKKILHKEFNVSESYNHEL